MSALRLFMARRGCLPCQLAKNPHYAQPPPYLGLGRGQCAGDCWRKIPIALIEGFEGNRTSLSRLRLALQDPHDRNYRVPIPCRRRHAVKLVDLAKTANRLHHCCPN